MLKVTLFNRILGYLKQVKGNKKNGKIIAVKNINTVLETVFTGLNLKSNSPGTLIVMKIV